MFASIFEVLGALLMGGHVAGTIRKGTPGARARRLSLASCSAVSLSVDATRTVTARYRGRALLSPPGVGAHARPRAWILQMGDGPRIVDV